MPLYNRTEPYSAILKDRYLLNREGSDKKTYHLVLDIKGGNLDFNPARGFKDRLPRIGSNLFVIDL